MSPSKKLIEEHLLDVMTHREGRALINEAIAEIKKLRQRDDMLSGLEQGGVDNWEWYSESLKDYYRKYYPGDFEGEDDETD